MRYASDVQKGTAEPEIAVRIRVSAKRGTETERFHGLVLLRLKPLGDPRAGFDPVEHVSVERLIGYGDPYAEPSPTAASWTAFIQREVVRTQQADSASGHLQRDFDANVRRPFLQPRRFAEYYAAALAIARTGASSAPPRSRALVEDIHHEIFYPLLGEAGQAEFDYGVEEMAPPVAPANKESSPAGAPAAEAPAAAAVVAVPRPVIPFFPAPGGKAAAVLQPNDVIAPERDRGRQWIVESVGPCESDADAVVVRCRLLGPFGVNEVPSTSGAFRALGSMQVPLAAHFGPVIGADGDAACGEPRGPYPPCLTAVLVGIAGAAVLLAVLGLLRLLE